MDHPEGGRIGSPTDNMLTQNLKICGITDPETARFCADAGVGALGAVFFRKSPRAVTPDHARAMFADLPRHVARVGVFVDRPVAEVIAMARQAALDTVQFHGSEPLEDLLAAQRAGFRVIKVLKVAGDSLLKAAAALPETVGVLVECGKGTLPGGNGAVWSWAEAAPLAALRPFALAGGLTPENIGEAARLSRAVAWDLSSGVESAPGVKNQSAILKTVKTLTDYLRQPPAPVDARRFWSANPTPNPL